MIQSVPKLFNAKCQAVMTWLWNFLYRFPCIHIGFGINRYDRFRMSNEKNARQKQIVVLYGYIVVLWRLNSQIILTNFELTKRDKSFQNNLSLSHS